MNPEVRELSAAQYPPRLRDLRDPPERLWLAGELPRQQSIAIVGTRHPSEGGRAFARSLAAELSRAGVAIFSGGAKGIDTAAHEGALDAGGRTLVVAPSAFDRPYPAKNAELFRRVVHEGGGYLTRFPPGTPARRFRFHLRNDVLVALADAVLVVETDFKGGSVNACAAARRIQRPVLVVPGAPWVQTGRGCVVELRRGGLAVGSAGDVLTALGRPVPRVSRSPPVAPAPPQVAPSGSSESADADVSAVRRVLLETQVDLDELHIRTGIPVGRLRALLLTLTLEGVLVSSPSGQLSLSNA